MSRQTVAAYSITYKHLCSLLLLNIIIWYVWFDLNKWLTSVFYVIFITHNKKLVWTCLKWFFCTFYLCVYRWLTHFLFGSTYFDYIALFPLVFTHILTAEAINMVLIRKFFVLFVSSIAIALFCVDSKSHFESSGAINALGHRYHNKVVSFSVWYEYKWFAKRKKELYMSNINKSNNETSQISIQCDTCLFLSVTLYKLWEDTFGIRFVCVGMSKCLHILNDRQTYQNFS